MSISATAAWIVPTWISYECPLANKNFVEKKQTNKKNTISYHLLQVVLAANDMPALNDITYPELIDIISKVSELQQNTNVWMVSLFSEAVSMFAFV